MILYYVLGKVLVYFNLWFCILVLFIFVLYIFFSFFFVLLSCWKCIYLFFILRKLNVRGFDFVVKVWCLLYIWFYLSKYLCKNEFRWLCLFVFLILGDLFDIFYVCNVFLKLRMCDDVLIDF